MSDLSLIFLHFIYECIESNQSEAEEPNSLNLMQEQIRRLLSETMYKL
jgi:hypothetical protein